MDGISLRTLLDRLLASGEAMPWNIALRIAMDIAGALEFARGASGGFCTAACAPTTSCSAGGAPHVF